MRGQGMCLIDTAASVKACFVEGSLCVFPHFSAVPGALPKSPWHQWPSWEGAAPKEWEAGEGVDVEGGDWALEFPDPRSWHFRPEHLKHFLFFSPPAGDFAFPMRASGPEFQGKWIALSHQQWWLLILLVKALDNFFFRPGRGLSSVAPALPSKTSEIFSSVPALSLSLLSLNSNGILTFLLVDKSSCISYISWDVITKKINHKGWQFSQARTPQSLIRQRIYTSFFFPFIL